RAARGARGGARAVPGKREGPPVELGNGQHPRERRGGRGRRAAAAGRAQPVDGQEKPGGRAAAPGGGGRGQLRSDGGRPRPAYRAVQALAAGPGPAFLHIRPTGAAVALQRGRSTGRQVKVRWALAFVAVAVLGGCIPPNARWASPTSGHVLSPSPAPSSSGSV